MTAYQTSSGFNAQAATAMPTAAAVQTSLTTNWSRVIAGTTGNTTLNAIYGNDTLIASGSGNTLIGGSGLSTLVSNAAGNTLEAGTGPAVAEYVGIVNLASGRAGINGASVSDTLVGIASAVVSGASDTLIAGTGTDTLSATGSSDIYQFARGDGQAIIVNGASTNTSASNELDFAAGISDQQLWFLRSGNDLQIDVMGTSSKATVAGWFTSPRSQLSEITRRRAQA